MFKNDISQNLILWKERKKNEWNENSFFYVTDDGFYGELFESEKEIYLYKDLIICSSSDGKK